MPYSNKVDLDYKSPGPPGPLATKYQEAQLDRMNLILGNNGQTGGADVPEMVTGLPSDSPANTEIQSAFLKMQVNNAQFKADTVMDAAAMTNTTTSTGGSKRRRRWSNKYKSSINCRRPKGFSQRQYCKYGRKRTRRRQSKRRK